MKTQQMVRQGDVLLIPVAAPKANAIAPAPKDPRGIVLAEGESSGHHHAVFGRGAKLFRFREGNLASRILTVGKAGAEVRVEGGGSGGVPRHLPVQLAPGAYEVRIQRAWSAEDEKAHTVHD